MAMQIYNFGPPAVDFSPLSNLGQSFMQGFDQATTRRRMAAGDALAEQAALADASGFGLQPQVKPLASIGDVGQIKTDFISAAQEGGLSNPYALAAVAATGARESGFSPNNVQRVWNDPSESGKPGTSGGLMSWRNERLDNARRFAQSRGEEGLGSPKTQAQFFLSENPALVQQLNAAKSVEEAAELMANSWRFAGYNRPGGEAEARVNIARSLLPRFQTGQINPADLPSANATQAQGFSIPGQGQAPMQGQVASPYGNMPPRLQQMIPAMLANPNTAKLAEFYIKKYTPDQMQTVQGGDGNTYFVNPRTGAVTRAPIPGKPVDQWSYTETPNGDLVGFNAATGKREIVNAGEKDATLRQYQQAKREGFNGTLFDFKKQLAEAGASKTNVNTNPGPSTKVFDEVSQRADAARSAAQALPAFTEAQAAIDGGAFLGSGADLLLSMNKLGSYLGLDNSKAANTEVFASAMAPTVLSLVRGLGAGSGISNADREFAEKAAGGNIKYEEASIRRLINIGVKASKARIASHKEMLDKVYPDSDPQNAQVRALFNVEEPKIEPKITKKPALGQVPIPPKAVTELRAMPDTPETRSQFDEIFGEGAAARILGKGK